MIIAVGNNQIFLVQNDKLAFCKDVSSPIPAKIDSYIQTGIRNIQQVEVFNNQIIIVTAKSISFFDSFSKIPQGTVSLSLVADEEIKKIIVRTMDFLILTTEGRLFSSANLDIDIAASISLMTFDKMNETINDVVTVGDIIYLLTTAGRVLYAKSVMSSLVEPPKEVVFSASAKSPVVVKMASDKKNVYVYTSTTASPCGCWQVTSVPGQFSEVKLWSGATIWPTKLMTCMDRLYALSFENKLYVSRDKMGTSWDALPLPAGARPIDLYQDATLNWMLVETEDSQLYILNTESFKHIEIQGICESCNKLLPHFSKDRKTIKNLNDIPPHAHLLCQQCFGLFARSHAVQFALSVCRAKLQLTATEQKERARWQDVRAKHSDEQTIIRQEGAEVKVQEMHSTVECPIKGCTGRITTSEFALS